VEQIDNTKKYFESQLPDEKVVLLIRRHFFAILPYVITASFIYFVGLLMVFVIPALLPSFVSGFVYNIYILVVSCLFLFTTAFLFHNWALHYLRVAILTDDHFVEVAQAGLFSRKVSQMSLDKVQDVSANQKGVINTMFNLGTVDVQTAGELPNFLIELVPDPSGIAQKVMQIEEEYCERVGLKGDGLTKNANVTSRVTAIQENVANLSQEQQYAEPTIEYPTTQEPPQ
jgi:uncharacterized membrane protein YdbT with pleckstrin-like domain